MKITKVTCDGCGEDLTTRTNIEDYRLVLASESKPGYGGGVYTCMGKYPAISRSYHFCALKCLDHWRDHERLYGKVRERLWGDWKEKHGTKINGRISSYPSPSDEISKEWDAKCFAEANAAFPLPEPPKE